ncbi:hypothetical protein [Caudoviricetes sp.]|nr:hypothetical protein [Caudoviricetes sp.]UOF81893.1 hypothetical protein [Caudoviricetes sp.]
MGDPTFGNIDTGNSKLSTSDKWSGYTGQIDHILGSMSPEDRAAVEGVMSGLVKTGDPAYNAAVAAFQRYGYTPEEARGLVVASWSVRKLGDSTVSEADRAWLPGVLGKEPVGAAGGPGRDDIMGKLSAFYKQLTGPLPNNDPTAQYIQRHAVNAAQRYGGAAGMSGRSTLGAGAASAQYTNGMQAYDMQRKQLATQVAGLMNQRDLGLGQLQQGYIQYQNQLEEAKAASQKAQMQGIGAAVGTGLGAAAGAYFGGAQGAQVGMQAGGQFGGGLAGMFSPQPNFSMGGSSGSPAGIGGRNPYTGY